MVRHIIPLLLMLAWGLAAHAQIGAKVQQSSGSGIHGVWVNNDFGYQMMLTLDPGGTGVFDGVMFDYKTEGNKLTITQEGKAINYTYVLRHNTLTLSGGDIDGSVSFKRSGNLGQAAIIQPESSPVVTPSDPETKKDSNTIVGAWSGNGETMEFLPNGMVQHLGQTYPYKYTADKITVSSPYGELTYGYVIKGDRMILTNNIGESLSYLRDAPGAAQINQSPLLTEGTIDPSLVGKWCYVDVANVKEEKSSGPATCYVLNVDGTYSSLTGEKSQDSDSPGFANYTDRGTWYVKDGKFFFSSQIKGPGSFQLEKKNHPNNSQVPMIVLDGQTYVSFSGKEAWKL